MFSVITMYNTLVTLTAVGRKTLEAVVPITASHDVLIVSGHRETTGAWCNRLV